MGASGQIMNWIRHGVLVKFKNGLRLKPFNHGVSMKDAAQPQLDFLSIEMSRFETCGAWERSHNTRYVSRMFLVPKPIVNKWCLMIDLREQLKSYCADFNMSCETLKHLRHLSRPGDYTSIPTGCGTCTGILIPKTIRSHFMYQPLSACAQIYCAYVPSLSAPFPIGAPYPFFKTSAVHPTSSSFIETSISFLMGDEDDVEYRRHRAPN
jgi:hypothetical protein